MWIITLGTHSHKRHIDLDWFDVLTDGDSGLPIKFKTENEAWGFIRGGNNFGVNYFEEDGVRVEHLQ